MTDRASDRLAISDLINGWILRDNGEWDKLRDLFHSDGVVEVTWFEGALQRLCRCVGADGRIKLAQQASDRRAGCAM